MSPAAQSAGALGNRRVLVHQHLVGQAHAFITDPERKKEFDDPAIPAFLAHVLINEGLVSFSRNVRKSVSLLNRSANTMNYWDVIDAIGFWEDSTPGRWPQMTLKTMSDRLDWAEQYQAGTVYQRAA